MPGQLFTHYFLTDGIKATPEWRASAAAFEAFRESAAQALTPFAEYDHPNEALTEQDLIRPVLESLGWADYLPQQGAARNEDIPDHLLFADAASKDRAAGSPAAERYRHAAVVEESKRFGLPLDSRDTDDKVQAASPHGQILRYLSTADEASDGGIRWGILTNGGVWRLYDHRARPRATAYYEADLGAMLTSGDKNGLRLFHLLFRRESFTLQNGATVSFLETALAEGRRYEAKVAQDLSSVVFGSVFPELVRALADATGEALPQVRHAALIFLYRLLFVLYAEDRGLLPVNDRRYEDYGLRKPVRQDIASRTDQGAAFSASATHYYDHLMMLCGLIDRGDPSIGLPPYNGGLFAAEAAPLLAKVRLADATVAPLIYDLSHAKTAEGRRFVNYRDMSVQQLGSLYERLLEREPVRDEYGEVVVRLNSYARKDSGSFFTPQELVDLIVDRTLKPLAEERLAAFEKKAAELAHDTRTKAEREAELRKLDPAEAVLDLKVLDPAMGSGHFLVTAVDFLSDYVAALVEYVPAVPEWLGGEYVSPLLERVATVRLDILQRARAAHWVMDETLLTDQAIIRRMVLKRCIYGVDKNPLTVELAKVSLWLHSFTVGAPLSFLDHHLRCGDSLVGLRVNDATKDLGRLGGMYSSSAIQAAESATKAMHEIEQMSDADIAEVRESVHLFRGVEATTSELRGVLDTLTGVRWLTAGMKAKERRQFEEPLVGTLTYKEDGAYQLIARGPRGVDDGDAITQRSFWPAYGELWSKAKAVTEREGFLHWEAAFPGVWRGWLDDHPQGGFDAVIGNPPWDRIKFQEKEWFDIRSPEIAKMQTADERKAAIRQLRARGAPLTADFDAAKERAKGLTSMVRASGYYPLLSGGDTNLYSLFVERAMALVKPDGFVGLLTPSGIYADKTASAFFKSVSTGGRVSSLFDFENRKVFFKGVHSSQKFCVLVLGGEERRFDQISCAFFLHDTETIHDPERCLSLTPSDFARVNPNTNTAPVFRTWRAAELTRRIYEQHPALVDRSHGGERRAWPIKYATMFHMTNDSSLFRTRSRLETDGFYPIEGNRWKRGEELYVILYEGKMVQAFDHRAADIVVHPEKVHRSALAREASHQEHADPSWAPEPQYWVGESEVEWSANQDWTVAFKDATATTNSRTMIAAVVPRSGYGNTLPILMPTAATKAECVENSLLLVACLNSIPFDFVARQKGARTASELVHRRTTARHRARGLRPAVRRDDRPRAGPRPCAAADVHGQRYGAIRPGSRLQRHAVRLGRGGAPPPARPARRALLPPLRPLPRGRRVHPGHVPHRARAGREGIWGLLPHP